MPKKKKKDIEVATIVHKEAKRRNIPTAEYQSMLDRDQLTPVQVAYSRRDPDLDPQLIWRGKDLMDWSDLVVPAPPLYIQEKIHPKVLIDDLKAWSREKEEETRKKQRGLKQLDLFAAFNGIPDPEAKTEFYQHEANWSNRMILGDSMQVMASLAEREGLRGKVQCIYIDPPYGIKFNSNFQWSTTSRDVKDGKKEHITREPEQVKAFRDTWRDGIHSYLTYLRDRLTVARDLLTDSGSIFVQIGDENVHRVRCLMDEVFGEENFVAEIRFRKKTMPLGAKTLEQMSDYIIWYAKTKEGIKFRHLFYQKDYSDDFHWNNYETANGQRFKITKEMLKNKMPLPKGSRRFRLVSLWPKSFNEKAVFPVFFRGKIFIPPKNQCWPTSKENIERLIKADHIELEGKYLRKILYLEGSDYSKYTTDWLDTIGSRDKNYVVQTSNEVIQRCILMTTDPGDLVLDPTCGSGTTAYVAEQWGRRWITIDTSRVALALARARLMGARYPYYILTDSPEGQKKIAEITGKAPSSKPTYGNIRHGFVYERVPHITLKAIANNAEIDVIWEKYQEKLEPLRRKLNDILGRNFEEWEIPREPGDPWPDKAAKLLEKIREADTDRKKLNYLKKLNAELNRSYTLDDLPDRPYDPWNNLEAEKIHSEWWKYRIERQKEIDESIARNADYEYLYDRPYEDKSRIRVAGPFTVESLSPHRTAVVDEDDELVDKVGDGHGDYGETRDFVQIILENLKTAGIQQAHKEDKIDFVSLRPWPGEYVCAEGVYMEGGEENGRERRAGIFIGPEFGTVSRPDLVRAAREAAEAGFDVLVACAFNFEAHTTEFNKLGPVPILKARMNADLHMAGELKDTDRANLFVIFGEPDIDITELEDNLIQVKINGVDVFDPNTGEIRSDGPDGIACWFIDTDYNEESFFVRHAYFLGAGDPYKALKTTLKAEINREAWESLYSDVSRPFPRPVSGRIAVKVINHLGDEVMKVFRV